MKPVAMLLLLPLFCVGCSQSPADDSPDESADVTAPATTASAPAPVAAAGGDAGKKLFEGTCSACHGADGHGIPGLGKPLTGSKMLKLNDKELVAFIRKGRDTSDPENTTHVAMPPSGGNPALSETDLQEIVGYIRSLK